MRITLEIKIYVEDDQCNVGEERLYFSHPEKIKKLSEDPGMIGELIRDAMEGVNDGAAPGHININKKNTIPLKSLFSKVYSMVPNTEGDLTPDIYYMEARDDGEFKGKALWLPNLGEEINWIVGTDSKGVTILIPVRK